MKLQNKKTGEILDGMMYDHKSRKFTVYRVTISGPGNEYRYDSLADLCEEWEDYKDDGYWHITRGQVFCSKIGNCPLTEYRKAIGDYFRTKEEAEQAVEKLKAYKRLKDAGFKFDQLSWDVGSDSVHIYAKIDADKVESLWDDLHTIFGECWRCEENDD